MPKAESGKKEQVALTSIWASLFMTISKFSVGFATGSLGLVSEGLHSLLDLGATIMTYMAVRVSDKPADEEHPYGHAKIESVAALAETALLFLTSLWIVNEAVHRLLSQDRAVEATWWSVAVICSSILLDIWRSRTLARVARETKSQALEADALHFTSDIFSSGVVLCGLAFVALGWKEADAIAAIGVSLFVCKAGWTLGRRTIDTLIDTAPEGTRDTIRALADSLPSVVHVGRVRVRPAGSVLFVDLDVSVSRSLPLSKLRETREELISLIRKRYEEAEVMVEIHPVALDSETVHDRVHIIASGLRLAIHHVTVHGVSGRIAVGLDLEVDGQKTLKEAHEVATRLESSIREELGEDIEVETHIEPLVESREIEGENMSPGEMEPLAARILDLSRHVPLLGDIHDIRARKTALGTIILFHCLAAPSASVAEVHEAVDKLERMIRETIPSAWRVVGHAEPDVRIH